MVHEAISLHKPIEAISSPEWADLVAGLLIVLHEDTPFNLLLCTI